jgi:predicted DNA-binding transcriptional regulator YafY
MARGEQLGRQWTILQILISSITGKSVSALAKKINCHTRTIYRDLEALQLAGFPIYDEKQNGKSVWSILDSGKKITMPLSLPELMALYFGRDLLNVLKNTVFHDSLKSLFSKIKTNLPEGYITFLEQFEKNLKVGQQPYKYHMEINETLSTINTAIEKRKCIDIKYFVISKKKKTQRRVAPYNIWYSNGTFYIIGHCMVRKTMRTFACDRIKTIDISDEAFKIPEDFNIDEYIQSSFGVFHGETTKVKIWFSSEAAEYIKEKKWHESQEIIEQGDGSILFKAEVAGIHDIKIWVMSWGAKAKVIGPKTLKEMIKAEINLLANLYP